MFVLTFIVGGLPMGESYQMSERFVVSEGNSNFRQPKRHFSIKAEEESEYNIIICYVNLCSLLMTCMCPDDDRDVMSKL
jgi:hypothetical protein